MSDINIEGVRCGKCGAAIAEPPNTPLDARLPCPSCASKNRTIAVSATETLRFSSHVSALQERGSEAIAFSETEREGRASRAALSEEGVVEMAIVGSSPQGEEDTPAACNVLKERLNAEGARWDKIIPGSGLADCVFVDSEDPHTTLDVQVVRAIASQNLWRRLNSSGSVQASLAAGEAANEIQKAIDAKARDEKIPRPLRAGLLLALDATRLPGIAFDAIVREFRSTFLEWVRSHGFAAVWLIGPVSRLCWRLD
jgi:hypothetical protein